MKLVQCEQCGKFSPRRLRICPYCDAAMKKAAKNNGRAAMILFWLFNVVMAIWHIAYWVTTAAQLEKSADASKTGQLLTSAFTGSGEIVVYWLAGCLVLGSWGLLTRD
jgi:predicted nucleic acid-binding Zn ribbon protein